MERDIPFKNFFGILVFFAIIFFDAFIFLDLARAGPSTTNISSSVSAHWAWNDLVGWMDFYNTQTIIVRSGKLTGYASSSVGDISLDCGTTRNGNICPKSNYKVTNDGNGNLSGWGWNDAYGWISFDCNNTNGCSQSNYRVYIDANGNFQNYAWNSGMGWISFNCDNIGGCSTADYRVVTSWAVSSTNGFLDSTTYDTGVANGVQLNSVLWRGNLPGGTAVRFQFATSNSPSGPWTFIGPDGTNNTYYSTGPNVSLRLDYALYNNQRYFRYRVTLVSDQSQQLTPRVDEIIINWSP